MTDLIQRFRLDGKVCIVTGASKGIGAAIARGFAQSGAKVVVSSRKQEAVDQVAQELVAAGHEAVGVAAHAGKADDLARLVDATVARFGGVDVVVNNAATNPAFGPLLDVDQGMFDKILEVNLKGPFELAKRVQPLMVARGGGSIINISSIGGVSPEPGLGAYSVSKAALISLTKAMAKEWSGAGVRVNAICPALIETKFAASLMSDDEMLKMALGGQPIDRPGQPDEVATLALFLASQASSYCTGGVYMVDGGHTA